MSNTLLSWDALVEQKKADFMEHLYQVYQPVSHCYTGLWEKFKVEAAMHCREEYFERLKFIQEVKKELGEDAHCFISD